MWGQKLGRWGMIGGGLHEDPWAARWSSWRHSAELRQGRPVMGSLSATDGKNLWSSLGPWLPANNNIKVWWFEVRSCKVLGLTQAIRSTSFSGSAHRLFDNCFHCLICHSIRCSRVQQTIWLIFREYLKKMHKEKDKQLECNYHVRIWN